jgi:hypothetical protein
MRRSAYVAVVVTRPHPGAALRPDSIKEENAVDDDAVLEHVVVVLVIADGARLRISGRHFGGGVAASVALPRGGFGFDMLRLVQKQHKGQRNFSYKSRLRASFTTIAGG